MNVYLVGFMGTGKTAVAREVSNKSGLTFVEMDKLIEEKEQCSINKIFENKGEACFRQLEKEILRQIALRDDQIVSCGGGVVLDEENIETMKRTGLIICLEAPAEVIYKRIKHHAHRPLLNVDKPREKIEQLLKKRKSFYSKADFSIDTNQLNIKEVAQEVINHFSKNR
jgi:shikimate kinase